MCMMTGERVGFIITIKLAIVLAMTMIEANAAPAGDLNPPRILGFILTITR